MAEAATKVRTAGVDTLRVAAVEPPSWALDLVEPTASPWSTLSDGLVVRELGGGSVRLVSVRVCDLLALDADGVERRTCDAYRHIASSVESGSSRHPVRVWNFIPGILQPLGSLQHRYMSFNAGRFLAYESWFAGRQSFERLVPTASGVGHDGSDLLVHCLLSETPGLPVENPRQVPSYCYSAAYGPLPPCFARATVVELGRGSVSRLLVGGTAAVRGEDSVHPGNLEAQAEETFANLAALVRTALERRGAAVGEAPRERFLSCYRALRVYYRRQADRPTVERMVRSAFTGAGEVELRRADLCRDPLLIEIEGVADLER